MNTAIKSNQNTNFVVHLRQTTDVSQRSHAYESFLMEKVNRFKNAAFSMFEYESRQQEDMIMEAAGDVATSMLEVTAGLHKWLGPTSILSDEEKASLGSMVRREMLPYLLTANISSRSYLKPRGYAGDFLTIADMYADQGKGESKAARVMDQIFLQNMCCNAVKNRRGLLHKAIMETIRANDGQTVNITSFACGPAQELFDTSAKLDREKVNANLIDIDLQALSHVGRKLEAQPQKINFNLHQNNLIHLALGRRSLNLPLQDLVYSIGLIDYFDDKLVIKLIDYAHSIMKEGGRIILGNFHDSNPMKEFMDHVLEWKLIHRSEEDMNRLFKASKFGKGCSEIRYESEGINLFAICTK